MVLSNEELAKLERKYLDIISKVISNNIGRFINEINSQKNMPEYESTKKDNPIEQAAENIMNAMIARSLDWSVASMPSASDSCYECGDAIIHIDAKTILDSDGDSRLKTNRIDIRQNQTSFDFETEHEVIKGNGTKYIWKPKLHRYEKHKTFGLIPNLTFFLRVTCSKNSHNKIQNLVEDISLISIPNGQFFNTHKKVLGGVKSYPTMSKNLEHLRFNIKELIIIDSWRELLVYKRN